MLALGACGKGRSTLGLDVHLGATARTVRSLRLLVTRDGYVWGDQRYAWVGPGVYAVFLPGTLTGDVDVVGSALDDAGELASGSTRVRVSAGQVIGPAPLLLRSNLPDEVPDAGTSPDGRTASLDVGVSDVAVPDDAAPDLAVRDGAAPDVAVTDAPATDGARDGSQGSDAVDAHLRRAQGQPCADGSDCVTGFCVDGACCNNGCAGACLSCRTGLCTAVTNADDVPACPLGSSCGPSGECRKKGGQTCSGPAECGSGYCVDGACCNEACSAPCQSCATGTCAAVRNGPDDPQCPVPNACDSLGACIAPPAGVPNLLVPWNGEFTGSALADPARRPRLRWTGVTGATSYDVQIDDSCSVGGFRSCTFPSPEATGQVSVTTYQPAALPVSMTPPVGRRYYWRVRACNDAGCGQWSLVRYMDVGRQAHDFNGDGYADVLGGTDAAQVYLFLGGAKPDSVADLTLPGQLVAAAGDVNGDGFPDMLVGNTTGSRRVFIYFGAAHLDAVADVTIMPPASTELFAQVASGVGDVDGDGYADVVIGAPPMSGAGGHVYLYKGGATMDSAVDASLAPAEGSYSLGYAVAPLGDTNGDGYADFTVLDGPPPSDSGGGKLLVFRGASRPSDIQLTPEFKGGGSVSISAGDVDGDGFGDVVTTSDGDTHVYGSASDFYYVNPGVSGTSAVAIGDLDGDGLAEIVVGAASMNKAYLFPGGIAPNVLPVGNIHPIVTFDGETPTDLFGTSVSIVGDVNGDGFPDVAIGAPYAFSSQYAAGRVYVFFGGKAFHTTPDLRLDGKDAEDSLGMTLACLSRPVRWSTLGPRGRW